MLLSQGHIVIKKWWGKSVFSFCEKDMDMCLPLFDHGIFTMS